MTMSCWWWTRQQQSTDSSDVATVEQTFRVGADTALHRAQGRVLVRAARQDDPPRGVPADEVPADQGLAGDGRQETQRAAGYRETQGLAVSRAGEGLVQRHTLVPT